MKKLRFEDWLILFVVAFGVIAITFNIWNFINCFNKPLAEAPARCLLLTNK